MNFRYRYVLLFLVLCSSPLFTHAQIELVAPNFNLVFVQNTIQTIGQGASLPILPKEDVSPDAGAKALNNFVAGVNRFKETVSRMAKNIDESIKPKEVAIVSDTSNQNSESLASPLSAIKSFFTPAPVSTTTALQTQPAIITHLDLASLNKISNLESIVASLRSLITKQSDKNSANVAQVINNSVTNNFTVSTGIFSSDVSIAGILSLTGATTTTSSGINLGSGCFAINGTCLSAGGNGTVTGTYPILVNASVVSLAFGTTTANSWSGAQTFLASSTLQNFTATNSTTTNATTTNLFANVFNFVTGSTTNLTALGSTTLQAFTFTNGTGTSATTTNLFANTFNFVTGSTTNLLAIGSTTLQNFTFSNGTGTSATTTNLFANTFNFVTGSTTNLLAIGSTTLQRFTATNSTTTNATTTNLFANVFNFVTGSTTNLLAIGSTTLQNFTFSNGTGTSATTTNLFANTFNFVTGSTTNLLAIGSTTLQRFTATNSTTTNATTTNFFSTLASTTSFFAGAATIGNNLSFTNNATTTIATDASGANWVIATTTNILAIPIISFAANGATSTISMFGATTTGIAAGLGIGLPSALKNQLIIGNGKDQASVAIVNGSICLDNDGWCTASTTAGRLTALGEQITASDLAEAYNSSENLEAGDVVSSSGGLFITLANQSNKEHMMGVVSTEPGVVLGLHTDQDLSTAGMFPVALAGRIPTKVNTENGSIVAGDYLTLSSVAGVATKALKAGVVIGQALESYSGVGTGKIMTFVKNSYYSGVALDSLPGLSSQGGLTDSKVVLASLMSGSLSTGSLSSHITTDTVLAGVEIITPKITTGFIYADKIESPTIDSLSSRVGVLENIKEWIISKITAVLGVFNRVEVGTASISQGLEMVDSANGNKYCLTIMNGEINKNLGACGSAVVNTNTNGGNNTNVSPDPNATTTTNTTNPDTEVSTSTPPTITPEPSPTSTPEQAPEPTPEPAPDTTTP